MTMRKVKAAQRSAYSRLGVYRRRGLHLCRPLLRAPPLHPLLEVVGASTTLSHSPYWVLDSVLVDCRLVRIVVPCPADCTRMVVVVIVVCFRRLLV